MQGAIISFFAFFLCNLAFSQSPIYVSSTATGTNDGSSWSNAYTSLTNGLVNASFGDEVWVSAGAYTPWDASDLSFELPSGVKLYGGFEGTESNLAERDWEANPTILSGKIDDQTYSTIVLLIKNPDTSTLVDGFTIRDAVYLGQIPPWPNLFIKHGGGVEVWFNSNGSSPGLTIRNCIIRDNFALQGAGMSVFGKGDLYDLFLENILIENNSAFNGGMGILVIGGGKEIIISHCTFKNNEAWIAGGAFVYVDDNGEFERDLTIQNCEFISNRLALDGGAGIGIINHTGKLNMLIDSCQFIKNFAGEPGNYETWGLGGAIYIDVFNDSTYVSRISNSVFKNNYCDTFGGAISLYSNNSQISNCIFIENEAGEGGGAIHSLGGEYSKISNCVFIDNQSEDGSAIFGYGNADISIHNSVFQDKTSSSAYFLSSYNSAISADNCYFSAPDCDSVFMPIYFDISSTFNCGPNNLFDIDPQFINEAAGDYRLDYCSPLIDAGDRAIVEQLGIQTDIAGVARIINGAPDIGAYENDDVLVNLLTQDLSCSGGPDGMAQVSPIGGQPPWTVEWSTGSNDFSIDSLASGNYWVSLTDANACTRYWEFEIGATTPIEAQFEVTDAWSGSSMDGAIDLEQIIGGNPPYFYNWNTGDTTSSIYDLSPGEYSLTITDSSDCDTTLVFNVGIINGIRAIQQEAIRLYPNPGRDRLWIESLSPGTQWQLFDAMGKLQMQGQSEGSRFFVQTAGLPRGVYFIRFYNSSGLSGLHMSWVKVQ